MPEIKVLPCEETNKSGSEAHWPFWSKMHSVLGHRPISSPVAMVNTMNSVTVDDNNDPTDDMVTRYGRGEIFTEKCSCGFESDQLFSSGVHVSECGSVRCYAQEDTFVCPKCVGKTPENDTAKSDSSPEESTSILNGKDVKPNDQNSSSSNHPEKQEQKKKNKRKNKESLKDVIMQISKDEKEQGDAFMHRLIEMEEKRMKIEDEREARREQAETIMFERQMEMLMQMQVQMLGTFQNLRGPQ